MEETPESKVESEEVKKESGLGAWLRGHGLSRPEILDALVRLGAEEIEHLRDLEDADIEGELGLRKLEKRRFRRALAGL